MRASHGGTRIGAAGTVGCEGLAAPATSIGIGDPSDLAHAPCFTVPTGFAASAAVTALSGLFGSGGSVTTTALGGFTDPVVPTRSKAFTVFSGSAGPMDFSAFNGHANSAGSADSSVLIPSPALPRSKPFTASLSRIASAGHAAFPGRGLD